MRSRQQMRARFEEHLAGCDGCNTYLSQTQRVMAELRDLSAVPNVNQQGADPEIIPKKTERHDA